MIKNTSKLIKELKKIGMKEIGTIDLTPDPDVEKFLEEKYKSQEESKKCTMLFKAIANKER